MKDDRLQDLKTRLAQMNTLRDTMTFEWERRFAQIDQARQALLTEIGAAGPDPHDRWMIVVYPDGFDLGEVVGSTLGPEPGQAAYRVRLIPGTFATIELAHESIGWERRRLQEERERAK